MNDIYTHYYSNSRHDGYIDVIINSKGELNWKKEFSGYAGKYFENRLILMSNERLMIDNLSQIVCLDKIGNLLWEREKWYGSQIVIKDNIIYYTSPERKDRMEAVTPDNVLVVEDFIIYDIIEDSNLQLFEPDKNEIIAQVQYTGVQEITTDKLVLYKIGTKSLGYDWSRIYLNESSPLIPLINLEKGFLLTAIHSDVLVFNLSNNKKDAEPKYTFPIPTRSGNIFVSSSKDGLLYFAFSVDDKIVLKCCKEDGTQLYDVQIQEEFANINKVIAPPVLANNFIYVLTNNKLICIFDKKVSWIETSKGLPFSYVTGLADNSILIAQGNLIKHFTSGGEQKFMYEIKDKITAPPVADKNGIVYFCSKEAVYSLK